MIVITDKDFDSFDFDSFLESVLIEFSYVAEQEQIQIVIAFVNWDLGEGEREFKKIIFAATKNFKRLFGVRDEFKITENNYHAEDYQSTHVIQNIKANKTDKEYWKITIEIDNTFGGFEFECKEIILDSKIGQGEQVGPEEWIYRDLSTKKVFDFYHPFST
jgi:hypothetical protein